MLLVVLLACGCAVGAEDAPVLPWLQGYYTRLADEHDELEGSDTWLAHERQQVAADGMAFLWSQTDPRSADTFLLSGEIMLAPGDEPVLVLRWFAPLAQWFPFVLLDDNGQPVAAVDRETAWGFDQPADFMGSYRRFGHVFLTRSGAAAMGGSASVIALDANAIRRITRVQVMADGHGSRPVFNPYHPDHRTTVATMWTNRHLRAHVPRNRADRARLPEEAMSLPPGVRHAYADLFRLRRSQTGDHPLQVIEREMATAGMANLRSLGDGLSAGTFLMRATISNDRRGHPILTLQWFAPHNHWPSLDFLDSDGRIVFTLGSGLAGDIDPAMPFFGYRRHEMVYLTQAGTDAYIAEGFGGIPVIPINDAEQIASILAVRLTGRSRACPVINERSSWYQALAPVPPPAVEATAPPSGGIRIDDIDWERSEPLHRRRSTPLD